MRAAISALPPPFLTRRVSRGFTLVELLVVVAIVAIVIFVASPNYSSVMIESKLEQERLRLATGLSLARSEAIQRSSVVRICPKSTSICTGSDAHIPAGFEWTQGWRIETQAGELIRLVDKQADNVRLTFTCAERLSFAGSGERASSTAHTGECVFTLKDPEYPAISRSLAVSLTGRTRML